MASIQGRTARFAVPDEPAEWMEFRRLSERQLRDREDLNGDGYSTWTPAEQIAFVLRWLEACLVGWSYDEPYEPSRLLDLDRPTLFWAFGKAVAYTRGVETREEKKADSPGSTGSSTEPPAPSAPTTGS